MKASVWKGGEEGVWMAEVLPHHEAGAGICWALVSWAT